MAGFSIIMVNKNNILPGTVGSVELADGSIAAADLLDGTISTQKLANDAVDNTKLDDTKQYNIDVTRGLYKNELIVTATGNAETKVLTEEEITQYNNVTADPDTFTGYIVSFAECAAERTLYLYNKHATASVKFGATASHIDLPALCWVGAYIQTDGDVYAITPIMQSDNGGLIKPEGMDRSQNFDMDITRALVQTELQITPAEASETIALTAAQCKDHNSFSVQATAYAGTIVSFANNEKARVAYIYNDDTDATVQFGATASNVVLYPQEWCAAYIQADGDVFAITSRIRSESGGKQYPGITVAASDAPIGIRAQAEYVCDGTDDHVQIQAALNSGLPVVTLSSGTFTIGTQLSIPAGVELLGSKSGTDITSAADIRILYLHAGDSKVRRIACIGATNTYNTVEIDTNSNILEDVILTNTGTGAPLNISAGSYNKINRVALSHDATAQPCITFGGSYNTLSSVGLSFVYRGVNLTGANNIIENCVMTGTDGTQANGYIIYITGASNSIIDSKLTSIGTDYGIGATAANLSVTNCVIELVNGDCINSTHDGVVVTNNILEGQAGVFINPASASSGHIVIGNDISVSAAGIEVNKSEDVTVNGNTVVNTRGDISPVAFLDSDFVSFSGNVVKPTNAATNGMYCRDSTHLVINGNHLGDPSVGVNVGIFLANTCTEVTCNNNVVDFATEKGIYGNTIGKSTFSNNVIYYFNDTENAYGVDIDTCYYSAFNGNIIYIKTYGATYDALGINIDGGVDQVIVGNYVQYAGTASYFNAPAGEYTETGNRSDERSS